MSTRSLTSVLLGAVLLSTLVIVVPGVLAQTDAPPDLTYQTVTGPGCAEPLEVPTGFTVDEVASGPDGSVLVSDDWSGRIFRIRYTPPPG